MNWKALIAAVAVIVIPLAILYVLLVVGGLLGDLLWGFLAIILLIGTITCIYFAIDDEMRNNESD